MKNHFNSKSTMKKGNSDSHRCQNKKRAKIALLIGVALLLSTPTHLFAYERQGGISVGAYGSTRLEIGKDIISGKDKLTFTLRRIVPTFSATIKERLRFYTELEFERFGLLELQEDFGQNSKEGYSILHKTEIEGSRGSEIKLEQMWGEFEIARPLRFRVGAVLPPVGRFNILHDDDIWEPARRPLSVRDLTVLPEKTAWTELGLGFTGNFDLADYLAGYELYLVNGVSLEHDLEVYLIRHHPSDEPAHNMLKVESVVKPRFGNFSEDLKREKAITGRFFFSPALGHEIGISGYAGRYTPSFLPNAVLWSSALDFKTQISQNFEIEGEYAFTQFSQLGRVVDSLAQKIYHKETEALFSGNVTGALSTEGNTEVELEMTLSKNVLADFKHGGWLLLRFKFFPSFLKNSPLYLDESSKFVLFLRPEIVSLQNVIAGVEIEDGKAELKRDSKTVFRLTPGIAYRPTETWVFSISYELTATRKDLGNMVLFGFAFGL